MARFALMAMCALGVVSAPASAQSSDSATADTYATVIGALTITKARDMDFGKIAGPAAGTLTMVPSLLAPTCTPSIGLLHHGKCQPAIFVGSGDPLQTVRIKLPAGDSIDLTGPGANMTVTEFVVDGDPTLANVGNGKGKGKGFVRYDILDPAGVFGFRVGGTLNVGANQTPGTYTGTFDVRLDYQ